VGLDDETLVKVLTSFERKNSREANYTGSASIHGDPNDILIREGLRKFRLARKPQGVQP
jgi:hypothetical protein